MEIHQAMETLRRPIGIYLIAVAVAVAVHFVLDPVIYDWADGETPPLWLVLDALIVIGLVLAIIVSCKAKRAADAMESVDVRQYVRANVTFYVAAGLLLVTLWNVVQIDWAAGDQSPDPQVWVVIDTVLPLLFFSLGRRLVREG